MLTEVCNFVCSSYTNWIRSAFYDNSTETDRFSTHNRRLLCRNFLSQIILLTCLSKFVRRNAILDCCSSFIYFSDKFFIMTRVKNVSKRPTTEVKIKQIYQFNANQKRRSRKIGWGIRKSLDLRRFPFTGGKRDGCRENLRIMSRFDK